MDAEQAFLDAQEYDPTQVYSAQPAPQDDDEEEEYDPDTALPTHPAPEALERTTRSSTEQSASMQPESHAQSPASATPQPAASTTAHTSPAKQQPPRTMGGFVVESEDEEDEAPGPAAASAAAAGTTTGLNVNGLSHSQSLSPSNTLAPSNVPVHSANDQARPGVSSSTSAAVHDAPPAQSPLQNGTPVPEYAKTQPTQESARPSQAPATPAPAVVPVRLPQDRVGLLEDRIAEDPRGDIEAWLSLIQELRRRHKIDDVRSLYDRFLEVFPTAAEQWNQYAIMELELEERKRVERVFERSIATNPYVPFWQTYINYVRRTHNMETDPDKNRPIITQVYEFTLDCIGIDFESGRIWADYIDFLRSSLPGMLGGTDWRDLQKMDTLRKVYHRAISVPTTATMDLWKDYNSFELQMNKATGRKHLQEQSPNYMNARSAKNVLDNITKGVSRTTLPALPPLQGFQGHDEYMNQVKLWSAWIHWEKTDPLNIKEENPELYNKRVIYIYKQALMALRFWPELWYEAAEWCYANNLTTEGDDFLAQGIDANPENCLLAFRQAHQIELKGEFEEGEAGSLKKGEAIRKPYDRVLDELYRLHDKVKKREEQSIARTKESFAAQQAAEEAARNANMNRDDDDDDDAELEAEKERRAREREEALKTQIAGISAGYAAQLTTLKKTISYAWVALMRAMRRVQGKGRPDPPAGQPAGFRGIFSEARKRGKLLSDAYVASALIEHHCYGDPAANKIFERGMKLFPQDEGFALEYVRHLVKQGDVTNARAVFETVVTRITSNPTAVPRVKRLFAFFHDYESQFGELTQIVKLETRMRDLFPEDPQLAVFKKRYASETFDPTAVRPVISLRSQMRPLMLGAPPVPGVVQSIEEPQAQPLQPPVPPVQAVQPTIPVPAPIDQRRTPPAAIPPPSSMSTAIPAGIPPHITNSPKRPYSSLADDDIDAHPRKMARAESPLKGAAGRRLDAARRNMGGGNVASAAAAPPLPREINFLMSIIPGKRYYHVEGGWKLDPRKVVDLFQRTVIPATVPQGQGQGQQHAQQQQAAMGQVMQNQGYAPAPSGWPPAPHGYGAWGGAGQGVYGGYGGR